MLPCHTAEQLSARVIGRDFTATLASVLSLMTSAFNPMSVHGGCWCCTSGCGMYATWLDVIGDGTDAADAVLIQTINDFISYTDSFVLSQRNTQRLQNG